MGYDPKQFEFLKTLSEAFGPSGCEGEVRRILRERVAPYADRIETDALGNLLVYYYAKTPDAPVLMLCAHMDEVGFMITEIDESGLLRFATVGGIDDRVLCGKRVLIGDEHTRISGVILEKPIHLQKEAERTAPTPCEKLWIDIGAKDRTDAETMVEIGAFGTFDSAFRAMHGTQIKGKALDDRAGCAILCEVLERLVSERVRTPYSLCFAFTVREEVGLSGAATAAHRLRPERAIILETTAVADLFGVAPEKTVAKLGAGGVLSLLDRATVYPTAFVNEAIHIATEGNIPYQIKQYVSGGNDAGCIQRSRGGVAVLALSAPCRYLHTASNVLDVRDLDAMTELVLALVQILCPKKQEEESCLQP